MSTLATMGRRELRVRAGQVAAMAVTVLLGVALFGASYDAFLNLKDSYAKLYEQTGFADFTASGASVDDFIASAGGIEGVGQIEKRRVAEIPVAVDGNKLVGRLVEAPEQAALNQTLLLEGQRPSSSQPDQVLLEQHIARHFDIAPGDEVRVLGSQGWVTVEVSGIAASPEYVWAAQSRQEILTPPGEFGVLFVSGKLLDEIQVPTDTQALVAYTTGADRATLDQELSDKAAGLDLTGFTRDQQPSNAALQEDVSGFAEMSLMFPILFLGSAGLALYVMLTRLVYSQRPIIGLLRASGFSRRSIFGRYARLGVTIGILGGVPGVIVGALLARLVSEAYTSAISVPITVISFRPATVAEGLVFALVAGALAGFAPALLASRIEPAAAMRGYVPPGGRGRRSLVERWIPPLQALPIRWLMVLRGVGRNKRRTASTLIGITLALVLVLTSWGMIDTTQLLLQRQFLTVQGQDAEVILNGPADAGNLELLTDLPEVAAAEPLSAVDVVLSDGGGHYATAAEAFQADTTMHTFLDQSDHKLALPQDGILAGVALRDLLDVSPGDQVTITFPGSQVTKQVTLAGFVDEPLGTFVYMSRDQLERLDPATAASAAPVALLRYSEGVTADQARARLETLDIVAAVRDSKALYETAQSFMGLLYAFLGVMLLFGGLMAFALIVASVSANVSEREVELATLEASGAGKGLLGRLISGETLALTLLGILPGLLAGYLISAEFMSSFSSDLFQFDLNMRALTPVWAASAVIVTALLALWPANRVLRRLDVAGVVRRRAL